MRVTQTKEFSTSTLVIPEECLHPCRDGSGIPYFNLPTTPLILYFFGVVLGVGGRLWVHDVRDTFLHE